MSSKEQIPSYDELVAIVRAVVPRCICEKPARHKALYKRHSLIQAGPYQPQISTPVCSRECFDEFRNQLQRGKWGSYDGKPVEFMSLNELTTRLAILVETIEIGMKDELSVPQDDASIRFSLLELD